MTKKKRL